MSNDKVYKNKNLQIIFLVTLMAVLGVSSITPAFPDIIDYFGINTNQVGLLITAFTLPGIFITPFTGVLSDRYGRKVILVPSLILFGLAGSVIAFLDDFTWILIFRLLQGLGSASLGSLNVTIISDLFQGKRRVSALGVNSSVLSIGTASYPAIGGSIALLGWKYVFLLPLLAIPVGLIAMKYLETNYERKEQHFKDYIKATLANINQGNVIILFVASVVTFIILYGSYLIYFPLLLDTRFNASSFEIGMMMSFMAMTNAVVSFNLGAISKFLPPKRSVIAGFLCYGISLIMVPFMPGFWWLIIPLLVFGFAQGVNLPSILTILSNFAPKSQRGAFMSLNGTVLRLGQTLGPIIAGWFFAIGDITAVFIFGTILSLLMMGAIIVFLKE